MLGLFEITVTETIPYPPLRTWKPKGWISRPCWLRIRRERKEWRL